MSTTVAQRTPTVGEPAPDFTLDSTSGHPITLSALRGSRHALLAFFPRAFTRVCTAELCSFSEEFDRFVSRDVEVLPISVDDVDALKEFKARYEMQTELLSDVKREASIAYGVLIPEKLVANRAYFLVDKTGIVRWAHVEEHGGMRRENDEILAQIARLG